MHTKKVRSNADARRLRYIKRNKIKTLKKLSMAKKGKKTTPKHRRPKKVAYKVLDAKKLGLKRRLFADNVIAIVAKLQHAGHSAYIVGGAVRDGLLGQAPKDFDVATDANPAQIKKIFGGRCRIIGRRFLLAHVHVGNDIIEVATFRRAPQKTTPHSTHPKGMIMRDNEWGNIEQDFARRDFSVNALYYNPTDHTVLDFCDALDDIQHKRLSVLGRTKIRIKEDPVRLLRALRFCAKLDFSLDEDLAQEFNAKNLSLLAQISHHRLFVEVEKIFLGGYFAKMLPLLYQYGIMDILFFAPPKKDDVLLHIVANLVDEQIAKGHAISAAYVYAAVLYPAYLQARQKFDDKTAMQKTLNAQSIRTFISKIDESFIMQIWGLQQKLTQFAPKNALSISKTAKFIEAHSFLMARQLVWQSVPIVLDDNPYDFGAWWYAFLQGDDDKKQALCDALCQKQGLEPVKLNFKKVRARKKSAYNQADFERLLAKPSGMPYKRKRVLPSSFVPITQR